MGIALRELFAEYGIEFDRKRDLEKGERATRKADKSLKKLDKTSDKTSKSTKRLGAEVKGSTALLTRFGAALGGVAVLEGFRRMVDSTTESTIEIARWSERLGMSEREMRGWAQTAQLFGGDMDDITDVLKELQLKARDAMDGTQTYIDVFKIIGLEVSDLAPIIDDQTALMDTFTDALNENTSAATQNFVVDELMSDAGTRMISMFREGTTAIRGYRREADNMGGREFPALARATRGYTLATRRLNQSWEAARNAIVLRVLPALTRGVGKLRDWLIAGQRIVENSHLMRAAMIAFGAAAAGAATAAMIAWGPAILTFVGVAAAVAAIILIVDDLYVTMDGGDSVTRSFLEWALGAEGAADAVLFLQHAIEDLRAAAMWLPNFLGGETTIGEGGEIEVTNVPSAIARGIQELSFGSGEATALTPEAAGELGRAQETLARRRREGSEQMEEWGLGPAPEDLGPQSVYGEAPAPRRRPRAPRTARGAPRIETTSTRTSGATVAIEAPMTVSVEVNEATDGDVVVQRATEAARAVSDETMSRVAREMTESLTSANELRVIGEAAD